ncbi:MAG TPA: endonuclease [Candidatus Sumerlaeota bacterium]|nr:endonuclease [Candidatus Sumerlaeota bacterium]HOR27512.1 endonuclease [Candidatus Sumerlaeota bacterium]HPK01872.1 endonuclease [Candidatus Sumerlaeota bacterium]
MARMKPETPVSRYSELIEAVFLEHYSPGVDQFTFDRDELVQHARRRRIRLPKNLGDVIYSFRYRKNLPEKIQATAPEGMSWLIRSAGVGRYRFVLTKGEIRFKPNALMSVTKIPDSTPGLISRYALNDEQALLAIIRYNRLLDIFTRVACYSLQSHLRSSLPAIGQVETDEIYVGVDRQGAHYVFPVQAKGQKDTLGTLQIEHDIHLCRHKFPGLICRPIAAQFARGRTVVLFEFDDNAQELRLVRECHYRLVNPDEISREEMERYRTLSDE